MPTIVKAYKCNWCPKTMGRKVNAIQHEDNCTCNPKSRHCRTCVYSYKKTVCIDGYNTELPYCAYHDKPIHEKPYLLECDCRDGEYGGGGPVPFTCMYYEYKGFAGYQKEVPCVVEEA